MPTDTEPAATPARTSSSRNKSTVSNLMQDAMEESSDDESDAETSAFEGARDMLDKVAEIGEHLALSDLPRDRLITQAFDRAYELIDQIDKPHGESAAEIEKQAADVEKAAKAANEALLRCKRRAMFSQYETVSEKVFPMMIRRWGSRVSSRVQRANEQGQEQLGQLMKRILKGGVNKRRRKGEHTVVASIITRIIITRIIILSLFPSLSLSLSEGIQDWVQTMFGNTPSRHASLPPYCLYLQHHTYHTAAQLALLVKLIFTYIQC